MFSVRRPFLSAGGLLFHSLAPRAAAVAAMAAQKRPFNEGKRHFKKNKKAKKNNDGSLRSEGSNEEVLLKDIQKLLRESRRLAKTENPVAEKSSAGVIEGEAELEIAELSSTGDGLAHRDGHVYVVPFTVPGDTVLAKVYKTVQDEGARTSDGEELQPGYGLADFVKVVKPSPLRTAEPQCPYFTQCSGCQFQHLDYTWQLAHKRRIVEKAYANFSGLPASLVPTVGETIGSPLQYGYRTKLTPHFDGPPNGRRDKRHGMKVTWPGVPPIGYMRKGTRKTMDIEDCPIGTQAVRQGLKRERVRVARDIDKYERGATLLLRESTERLTKEDPSTNGTKKLEDQHEAGEKDSETLQSEANALAEAVDDDQGAFIHRKRCITDHKATSTEYVDDFRFDNPAGAFFQNNNSILPLVTQYIRDNIRGQQIPNDEEASQPTMKYLIDAYCGSGFFTIVLSPLFSNSIGIDISGQSIASAEANARLNDLPQDSTKFIAADANNLFASLKPADAIESPSSTTKFAADETVIVIDPPRKGCDEGFIKQLLAFAPARICYVSCNVHTQARDVGMLVGESQDEEGRTMPGAYEIESLRGFDFFPQTSHVEGVAMLRRRASIT